MGSRHSLAVAPRTLKGEPPLRKGRVKNTKHKTMNKYIITVIALAGVVIGAFLIIDSSPPEEQLGVSTGKDYLPIPSGYSYALVGTKVGTTTTGVYWVPGETAGADATTTYPIRVGANVNTATFNFRITSASTTAQGPLAMVEFLGSNDWNCATTTTTSILNQPTVTQIQWYDVGKNIMGTAGATTLGTGTTTLVWTPTVGANKQITLTDLNNECLALGVNASATTMYVELQTK